MLRKFYGRLWFRRFEQRLSLPVGLSRKISIAPRRTNRWRYISTSFWSISRRSVQTLFKHKQKMLASISLSVNLFLCLFNKENVNPKTSSNAFNSQLYSSWFVDMERERLLNLEQRTNDETQPLLRRQSTNVRDYLWKCLGLPSSVDGEYIDSDGNSWRRFFIFTWNSINVMWSMNLNLFLASSRLLCAIVFVEDAVRYQSINHRLWGKIVKFYRFFSSSIVQKW